MVGVIQGLRLLACVCRIGLRRGLPPELVRKVVLAKGDGSPWRRGSGEDCMRMTGVERRGLKPGGVVVTLTATLIREFRQSCRLSVKWTILRMEESNQEQHNAPGKRS